MVNKHHYYQFTNLYSNAFYASRVYDKISCYNSVKGIVSMKISQSDALCEQKPTLERTITLKETLSEGN